MNALADPPVRRGPTLLPDRCENWAECYRIRMRYNQAASLEGSWRPPQGEHWLFGSAPPTARPAVNVLDGQEVNAAWQAIPDGFHQFLLAAHYVRKWSPDKCIREAREFDARGHVRKPVSDAEYAANLGMAHCLLSEQLSLPAVFRRARLADRVRKALDLDVWLAADVVSSADPIQSG
jgi:hypothetical protein